MAVKNYISLVKFEHAIFAMPFAMIGYALGIFADNSGFCLQTFILIILCMVFARNAAMSFNRYADRFIDAKNPRTESRELPTGTIRPRSALIFIIVNATAFIITCWFINTLVFFLSPLALLVILGYSLTKKYSSLCHFVLGVGLSLAPIGAYLAVTGVFAWLPIMFSLIVLLWSGGFDIIYALQDKDFDVAERLHSIPALLGLRRALAVSAAAHILVGVLTVCVGVFWDFGLWYATGAVIFLFLLMYQHLIVKADDLSRVNAAFFTSNGVASVIFSIFTIMDCCWRLTALFRLSIAANLLLLRP